MTFHSESSSTFTVLLEKNAHQLAEQLCQHYTDWQKAEQVYLNTLTIYAVDYYLKCLGYITDWENSDSHNIVTQAVLDIADLIVKDYGKLECRRVLPDEETVYIPEETWNDRLGYIAVSLSEALDTAEILGFFQQINTVEMPLSQLQTLDQLPDYLGVHHQAKPAVDTRRQVHLSQWFKDIFAMGWHSIEEVMGAGQPKLAFQFRGINSGYLQDDRLSTSVTRTKVFELGKPEQSVLVVITLKEEPNASMHIQIEILPTEEQRFLPAELQLSILDQRGEAVMEAQARETNDGMHLEFTANVNDCFSIKISLSGVAIVEDFLI